MVTGGIYNRTNDIEFFSSNGKSIATLKKQNGHIMITPEFSSRIEIRSDISSQVPAILLYDTIDKRTLFTIKPKTIQTVLQPLAPYTLSVLNGSQYGSFA